MSPLLRSKVGSPDMLQKHASAHPRRRSTCMAPGQSVNEGVNQTLLKPLPSQAKKKQGVDDTGTTIVPISYRTYTQQKPAALVTPTSHRKQSSTCYPATALAPTVRARTSCLDRIEGKR